MKEYLQVFTTTQKKDEAEKIAKTLLERRLAGCVQIIGPIFSRFWWNGNLETSDEWLCIIKSKKTLYKELEHTIKSLHKYEIPEIIALHIDDGNLDYLEWLKEVLKN